MTPAADDADRPPVAWVLRSSAVATIADLKAYGQVFQVPVEPDDRTRRMAAGQPCFLYVEQPDDPRVKPGIWAVGEVVGPLSSIEGTDGPVHLAEVELLPLQDRIGRAELLDHPVLGGCEVLTQPARGDLFALDRAQLEALEERDFAFVEPTPEQEARLAEALDELEEDDAALVLQVLGLHRSIGIVHGTFDDDGGDDDDDGDQGWSLGADDVLTVVVVEGDTAHEVGRYLDFADALEAVAHQAADLELAPPVPSDEQVPDGDPVTLLRTADGLLAIYRTGDEAFDVWDHGPEDDDVAAVPLGRFASLTEALAEVARSVYEVEPGGADDEPGGDGPATS